MPESNDEGREAQLLLLQQLYEQQIIDADVYRTQRAALGAAPDTVILPPAPDLASLRDRLDHLDDTQIDALALDHFPDIYSRFSRGMRRTEKINIMLEYAHYHTEAPRQLDYHLSRYIVVGTAEGIVGKYLRYVVETHNRLQLQGIRAAGQLVSVDLEKVYVPLFATPRPEEYSSDQPPWLDEMLLKAPRDAKRLGLGYPREVFDKVKIKVQDAMCDHLHLVVLGNPGSGKTTLLSYLALTYARDLAGEEGLVKARLDLDEQRLPILISLMHFAHYLEARYPDTSTDGPKLLLEYLHTYFENQDLALPARFFADRLQQGTCVVLLDGVDEVADMAMRRRVARLVDRFTVAYPDNRVVVTSRIVGYTGGARLSAEYAEAAVREFTQEDIGRFVENWSRAVEAELAGGETAHTLHLAQDHAQRLLKTVTTNVRVRELAVNPLLLTVIALVQRYRAQLPERRTELYEEAIEVLLGKWDEAKGLQSTLAVRGLELDAGDRRSLLEPIALWMMEQHVREIEVDELRRQLGERFHKMLGDWRKASKTVDDFLHLIKERSGLLTEIGVGVYAFSHLTFQEHLAARAIADRQDYITTTTGLLGDSWWREVILLEAGYLATQGKLRVSQLLRSLLETPVPKGSYDHLVLVAEALGDAGPARVEGDLWETMQQRLRHESTLPWQVATTEEEKSSQDTGLTSWWVHLLGVHHTTPQPAESQAQQRIAWVRRRAALAEAKHYLNRAAPIVGGDFWRLPYGEPIWIEIPAGPFQMGSEAGNQDELPLHTVTLERYSISPTPVTNAQYEIFVRETGYPPPEYWEDGRLPRGLGVYPVVDVQWYDALAYCQWLARVTEKPITLPSEAQWEKAARGTATPREYPWGDAWDATSCNTQELGLGGLTPVGVFPEGASPYGCQDMAGNVWEWTRSLWGQDWTMTDYAYPYNPRDGREDLTAPSDVFRVVRGGEAAGTRASARCAFRYWRYPDERYQRRGFRVVSDPNRDKQSVETKYFQIPV